MRKTTRLLEIPDLRSWAPPEKEALRRLAPLISLIPDLETWSRSQKRLLAAAIRARGRSNEFGYIDRLSRLTHLEDGIHRIV